MSSLLKTAEQIQRHYDTLITGDIHPVEHPVAKGDAREHGWRELFRRFFPDCYGVKSGFIIDSQGGLSQQIDCIVYRKDMGIELYSVGHHTVIPVESVFGAFEVKPRISAFNLKYAQRKARSVSELKISNLLMLDTTGNHNDDSEFPSAGGSIILGLLADDVEAKAKWRVDSFKELLRQPKPILSIFMTVKDGCVDTFNTRCPAKEYTLCKGKHALLNQLIRLAEGFVSLEKGRSLSSCYLIKYRNQLDKPTSVKF